MVPRNYLEDFAPKYDNKPIDSAKDHAAKIQHKTKNECGKPTFAKHGQLGAKKRIRNCPCMSRVVRIMTRVLSNVWQTSNDISNFHLVICSPSAGPGCMMQQRTRLQRYPHRRLKRPFWLPQPLSSRSQQVGTPGCLLFANVLQQCTVPTSYWQSELWHRGKPR